ncbi:MAG: glycoside hydrolase family 31 protein [Alistipes sp.]|nr:glycoside hydrolase family 31 protein [Alistipes sp.]
MKRTIILLSCILLSAGSAAAGAPPEKWWAGIISQGQSMPVEPAERFSADPTANSYGNQVQPLLLSDRGNVIWSEEPFGFTIADGQVEIDHAHGEVIRTKAGENLRDAYLYASRNFFPPQGRLPDELLFAAPQYNTWIELIYNQNQHDILAYAENIVAHGFPPGVLMIDDNWQEDYGKWDFHPGRFPDPKAMIGRLHELGFKVMLWICPFVSPDSDVFRDLLTRGAFLQEPDAATLAGELPSETVGAAAPRIVSWWNGYSAVLDLSNPAAREWFAGRLDYLQREYGVDGFKFDAGDAEYYAPGRSYGRVSANEQSRLFGEAGIDYPLNEYRAMWKMGGQPLVERLRDKSHSWNDLRKLVPSMALAGLAGYYFSCPDMVGGGEFTSFLEGAVIDQELIVRSAQCHALMPMMQFSAAPWRILDAEHFEAVKKCVALRQRYAEYILEEARKSSRTGEPILRQLEYAFPGRGLSACKQQFMLGPRLLVTPVVEAGVSQWQVTLPPGRWRGFDGKRYKGPATITVAVDLETLPYFELEK